MGNNEETTVGALSTDLTTPNMWGRARQAALELLKTVVGLSGAGVAFFATFPKDRHGIQGLNSWVFFGGLGCMAAAVALGLLGWWFQIALWMAWANELDPKKTERREHFEKRRKRYAWCRAALIIMSASLFTTGVIAAGICIVQRAKPEPLQEKRSTLSRAFSFPGKTVWDRESTSRSSEVVFPVSILCGFGGLSHCRRLCRWCAAEKQVRSHDSRILKT